MASSRFSCSICLDDFNNPKIIDCHHTFCEKCLADHIRTFSHNNVFTCPLCRRNISVPDGGVSGFSSNFYLEEALMSSEGKEGSSSKYIPRCDICKKENSSQFRCVECDQFMCQPCKTTHDSIKSCSSHVVTGLDAASIKKAKKTLCPRHSQEPLIFYCRDCMLTACYRCSVTIHSGHKIVDIDSSLRAEVSQELKKLQIDLNNQRIQFQDQLDFLKAEKLKIQNKSQVTCQQVESHVETICKEIRKVGRELQEEIEKNCATGVKTMDDHIINMEKIVAQAHDNLMKTTELLDDDTTVHMVNYLPNLCLQRQKFTDIDVVVPDVKITDFHIGDLNLELLYQQVGRLEFREICVFQSKFDLNETVTQGGMGREFNVKKQLRCHIIVQKEAQSISSILSATRNPKPGEYPHPLTNDFVFHAVLVNKDERKSLQIKLNESVTENQTFYIFKWNNLLDWKVLSDVKNGFIDDEKKITMKIVAWVKLRYRY
ncbi:hypothetical protein SNE40_016253 [Patella caerulea]|uniref:Uncharacterized protein n=1 Tax=Patella caerulea TaxID=87958 RepID=A0AAN8J8C7_PATCE